MLSEALQTPVISLQKISKWYAIYNHPRDRLKQMIWQTKKHFQREHWALREVDLQIYPGETVGIIGRNGSGKSTLLQIICGILAPSHGELTVNGRVAALLELGAGFNVEFSGRENIYLNGTLLGLSQREIHARFDQIVAFADIGPFLDVQVKTYSSGMYARLAFAVAIHVDPDILIIDEALSVGDEAFQRKCFSRIEQMKQTGKTILFVSHSAGNIVELCDRAVLLDQGERLLTDIPKRVVGRYQKLIYAPPEQLDEIRQHIKQLDQGKAVSETDAAPPSASQTTATHELFDETDGYLDPNLQPTSTVEFTVVGAKINGVHFRNRHDQPVNVLRANGVYRFCYTVTFEKSATQVRFGMMLKTMSGIELGGQISHPLGEGIAEVAAGETYHVEFTVVANLTPGIYFLNTGVLGLIGGEEHFLHRWLDIAMIRIDPLPKAKITGYVDLSGGQSCLYIKQAASESLTFEMR